MGRPRVARRTARTLVAPRRPVRRVVTVSAVLKRSPRWGVLPHLGEHVTLGRTNPEIASAMFVSRETIKTHLSHISAKLGVSSRSELVVAAARRDDLTPTTEPNTGATP